MNKYWTKETKEWIVRELESLGTINKPTYREQKLQKAFLLMRNGETTIEAAEMSGLSFNEVRYATRRYFNDIITLLETSVEDINNFRLSGNIPVGFNKNYLDILKKDLEKA